MANEIPELKPLDLSNLLKHAFMSGRLSGEHPVTDLTKAWVDYDPTDNAAYQRIISVLSHFDDTRGTPKPKVKPLGFVEDGDRWLTRRAEGYVITTHTLAPYWGVNDPHGNDLGVYDSLSDAEEAAQKDWREFISIHIE